MSAPSPLDAARVWIESDRYSWGTRWTGLSRELVWWTIRIANGRDGWLWWTDGTPPLKTYHVLSLVRFDYKGLPGLTLYAGPLAIHVGFPAMIRPEAAP